MDTLIDDEVAKAISADSEDPLYELWYDLERGREARIAAVTGAESDEDFADIKADVKRITGAQNRIVAEVHRRRLPERIQALRDDADRAARILPPDERAKPRAAAVAETPKRFPYGRRGWRQI